MYVRTYVTYNTPIEERILGHFLVMWKWGGENDVLYFEKVMYILIFFCKYIGQVFVARDMKYFELVTDNQFLNGILFDLQMAEILCCFGCGPEDTCHVIIE